MTNCKHIILATDNVTDDAQLSVFARLAMAAAGVPTDRFVVAVSTASLDASDKQTGFYGTDRALTEAAYWTTEHQMAIPVPDWLSIMFRMTITMLLTHTSM